MKVFLANLLYGTILVSASNFAIAEETSSFILGNAGSSVFAGNSVNDYCVPSATKRIKEGEAVFITGRKICDKYSVNRVLLEFAWRGETYLAEESQILLTDENRRKLEQLTEEDWSKLKANGSDLSLAWQKLRLEKFSSLVSSLKPQGVIIADWGLVDESSYTDGTSLHFEILNPTNKTIKYVWISVTALNPVGDPVGTTRTLKLVGPIEPDTSGTYNFDYVWMSDLPSTGKVRSIKVQYMDGSVRTLAKPEKAIFNNEQTELYRNMMSE